VTKIDQADCAKITAAGSLENGPIADLLFPRDDANTAEKSHTTTV